jgi:hypothetical protein
MKVKSDTKNRFVIIMAGGRVSRFLSSVFIRVHSWLKFLNKM